MPLKTVYIKAQTLTPLHHGTFAESVSYGRRDGAYNNLSHVRSELVIAADGTTATEVPIVSGNSVRGRLHRKAAEALFQLLGEAVGDEMLDALLNQKEALTDKQRATFLMLSAGGFLAGKKRDSAPQEDKGEEGGSAQVGEPQSQEDAETKAVWVVDHNQHTRTSLEALFPILTVFGYASGDNSIIAGGLMVDRLLPYLAETKMMAESIYRGHLPLKDEEAVNWAGVLSVFDRQRWPNASYTRVDSSRQYGYQVSAKIAAETEETADDAGTNKKDKHQSIYRLEYVPAGIAFLGRVSHQADLTDIERGLLYDAVDRFLAEEHLGGKKSLYYGYVQYEVNRDEIPDWRDCIDAYQGFIRQNASQIVATLNGMMTEATVQTKATKQAGKDKRQKGRKDQKGERS